MGQGLDSMLHPVELCPSVTCTLTFFFVCTYSVSLSSSPIFLSLPAHCITYSYDIHVCTLIRINSNLGDAVGTLATGKPTLFIVFSHIFMKNTVSFFLCFLRPTRPPHRFNKTIIELWLTRFFSGSCLDGREGRHHRFGIRTNSTIYTRLLPYFTLVLALRNFPKYVNQPICFLRWKRGLINADCTFSGISGTI